MKALIRITVLSSALLLSACNLTFLSPISVQPSKSQAVRSTLRRFVTHHLRWKV